MPPAIKGISLKKGDYVIGAAITDSDATRDKERDECAAKLNLTDEASRAAQCSEQAKEKLQKAREEQRNGPKDR